MSPARKQQWETFVGFLFHRLNFNRDVSDKNGSLLSGVMFAEGWRKAMVKNKIVGRYVNQNKLNSQMKKVDFNQTDEATGFIELGGFLSEIFQEVANHLNEQSIPKLSLSQDNTDPRAAYRAQS
ncbi:hypothetical protein BY996DRAFT_6511718 [Phakopsora pachyrhizi]|nr:hypothetical protein BY996DRAFT_6511718 [Phakopsora pachyrhizi]